MGRRHRAHADGKGGERFAGVAVQSKRHQNRLHHAGRSDRCNQRRALQGLYHRRDQERNEKAKESGDMPVEQTLAEQLRHPGFLAEPLQAAGSTHDQQNACDLAQNAVGPIGLNQMPHARAPQSDDHAADTEDKKDQRAAYPQNQFPRRAPAKRLARHRTDGLLHQHQQRDCGRQDEYNRSPSGLLLRDRQRFLYHRGQGGVGN